VHRNLDTVKVCYAMKVVFHKDFYQVYTGDPAAAAGRMESIVTVIEPHVTFVAADN